MIPIVCSWLMILYSLFFVSPEQAIGGVSATGVVIKGARIGVGTISVIDYFSRQDNDLMGTTWNEATGDIDIITNTAQYGTKPNIALCVLSQSVNLSNFRISLNVNGEGSSESEVGIVFCYQDTSNYYYAAIKTVASNKDLILYKVVAGTPAELGNWATNLVSSNTYKMEIVKSSDSIIVKMNSVARITVNDTTYSNGNCGLYMKNDNLAGYADDFILTGY